MIKRIKGEFDMDGKKAAIILIGIILIVSILIVIALSIFYSTYKSPINQSMELMEQVSNQII